MQLQVIQKKIYEIRGQKVMLDFDLAELYRVPTKALKQAVKRNLNRFPEDFMFELSWNEYHSLRSQFVTLKKGRGKYSKYLSFAFTEQGVAMLSSVLKSSKGDSGSVQDRYSNFMNFLVLIQSKEFSTRTPKESNMNSSVRSAEQNIQKHQYSTLKGLNTI